VSRTTGKKGRNADGLSQAATKMGRGEKTGRLRLARGEKLFLEALEVSVAKKRKKGEGGSGFEKKASPITG